MKPTDYLVGRHPLHKAILYFLILLLGIIWNSIIFAQLQTDTIISEVASVSLIRDSIANPAQDGGPKRSLNAPTVFGDKFCDLVINGKILGFQKIDIGKNNVNFKVNVEEYLAALGLTSLDGIRAEAYGKRASGTRSVTLIFDNGMLSFFIQKDSTLQMLPVVARTQDNSPILLDNIVVFGTYVVAISVSGIVTTDGLSRTFTELFEWPQPKLFDPKVFVDVDGNITIKAKNIITKEGKPGYYYIAADGTPKIIEEVTVIINSPGK